MSKVLKVLSVVATIASFIPGIGTAIGIGAKALMAIGVERFEVLSWGDRVGEVIRPMGVAA
ncbi:hypothetical protein [Novosphingobium sp. EMRT-2]|uniref:hypothetical protein n=1 Tax=Novosphingobium sp. EMRT-2 TaxID=2571749 RepID=UPI0010BDEAD4|nr:hypothetical protein [Novosphingobium sp. EMRT-2]QCI92125.1 hypothetical protein FA702_00095 [Novosphingobium sp. EMRT-2]QCI95163.1 hypothetical protein FA702_17720 [Novosphingobium sp. EMRT-2]